MVFVQRCAQPILERPVVFLGVQPVERESIFINLLASVVDCPDGGDRSVEAGPTVLVRPEDADDLKHRRVDLDIFPDQGLSRGCLLKSRQPFLFLSGHAQKLPRVVAVHHYDPSPLLDVDLVDEPAVEEAELVHF